MLEAHPQERLGVPVAAVEHVEHRIATRRRVVPRRQVHIEGAFARQRPGREAGPLDCAAGAVMAEELQVRERRQLVRGRDRGVRGRRRRARGDAGGSARGRERARTVDQIEPAHPFDRAGAPEGGHEERGDERGHETAGAGNPVQPGTQRARAAPDRARSCQGTGCSGRCHRGLEPGRERRHPRRRQQIGQSAALAAPCGVAPRPAPVAEALEPQLGSRRSCTRGHRADSTKRSPKAQPLHETAHAGRARAGNRPGALGPSELHPTRACPARSRSGEPVRASGYAARKPTSQSRRSGG